MNDTTEKQIVTQEADNDQTGIPSFEAKKRGNGSVAMEVSEDGNALLQQIFSTKSKPFVDAAIGQLRNHVMMETADNKEALINGLVLIAAIKPQDALESLLALQMSAVHQATMTFSRRLANVQTIQQQDSAERALNKLTRTFCAQMETLKKYRGGEQKITVQHQHVTVNDGGQAIVGTVEQGKGRGEGLRRGEQHLPRARAETGVLWCANQTRNPVQEQAHGERALPTPWWHEFVGQGSWPIQARTFYP